MYSLGMRREFRARHSLIGGDWGAENSEHAHRYRMELVLEALNLDRHGYLVDIVEVEGFEVGCDLADAPDLHAGPLERGEQRVLLVLVERVAKQLLDLHQRDMHRARHRALHLDLVRGKLLETRQHRALRRKAHQIADFGVER